MVFLLSKDICAIDALLLLEEELLLEACCLLLAQCSCYCYAAYQVLSSFIG